MNKIEITLIPKTAWNNNLRSHLSRSEWDVVRRKCYKLADYKCEICSGVGPKHPVECHEKWLFDGNKIILTGLIALCPSCHEVNHIGLAGIRGRKEQATQHLMKVNKITRAEAEAQISDAFKEYTKKSQVQNWELDVSFLNQYLEV